MNFENRWVLRSALNFASDGEVVREVGREFQRKGPEKAKADLAKDSLTRVKKKREEENDRKPGRLGLTVLNAEEVLKLMSKDYPEKYQEYTRFSRKRLKFVEKPGSASDGVTKLENLMKKAIKSAAEFNASLCKDRRQARSMYIDLQTMELHKPQSRKAVVNYSSVNLCDSYPVALVPGQYQHYYKRYTPTELNYFPLNTALYAPPKMMQSIYVDPNQPEKEASDEDVEQEEAVDDLLTTIPQTPSLDK
ncbi:hypothetical protein HELRODRAFT_184296, partial [Helobdella robusta]|uniref:Uncharacterized protein n=1 Tax=Helobdella robusta TaxID=6412 RepID=T1FKX7_HELRO